MKRQELTEQTKNNIKEAFWSLYRQKPIEKITVKEITSLAGYNRGTFYLYYRDTYDILTQMETELLQVVKHVVTEWVREDALHNLSMHMEHLMELAQKYSTYMGILLSEQGNPIFASQIKELLRPIIIHWVLNDQILDEQKTNMLTDFYLSGLLSVIAKWLNEEQTMSIEEFVQFIVQQLVPYTLHTQYR